MNELESKINSIVLNEHLSIEEVRKEMFELFNKSENKNLNFKNSTAEENELIAKWLLKNDVVFVGLKKELQKVKSIHLNVTDKMQFYSQLHCRICGNQVPISNFPIRITPTTRQVKTQIKNKFKENFAKSPYGKTLGIRKDDRLCIKIVFILNKQRDKDLDNMAKLTLDALKELIQIDDKNIDHLELVKLKSNYLESFISFRIAKSEINTKDDMILTGTNLEWAGLNKLDA